MIAIYRIGMRTGALLSKKKSIKTRKNHSLSFLLSVVFCPKLTDFYCFFFTLAQCQIGETVHLLGTIFNGGLTHILMDISNYNTRTGLM